MFTDLPNWISDTGNLRPNFAASLFSILTKLSNDLLEPLQIPIISSINLFRNRMASMLGMLGLALT